MKRWMLIPVVGIVIGVAAFWPRGPQQASSKNPAGGGQPTVSPTAGSSGGAATGTPRPGASGSATASPGPEFVAPSLPADYILFGIDTYGSSDDPLIRQCSLERGYRCKIRFKGRYRLVSYETAYIQAGAYENGASEPAWSTELPIKKGVAEWRLQLPYEPRQDTKTVKFVAILLDADHKPIFRGRPEPRTWNIPE